MTHKAKLTVAFVVVTAILSPLGCGDGPDQNIRVRAVDQTDRGFGGKRPRILSVNAALNPNNALMIDFQVTVSRPARVSVTYFDPLEPEFVVSKPTELDMSHQFTIVRLKAETEYHYKVMAVDEHDDRSPPQLGKFVTGSLPPGLLAPVTRIELVRGTGTTYPTLFDFNHQDPPVAGQFQPQFNGHVVLDSKARIVWYHVNTFRPRPGHSLMPFEIDRLPNGNFVYDIGPAGRSWDGRLLEMTPFGEIVHIGPSICTSGTTLPIFGGAHHEITPLADGLVLYLGRRVDRFDGLPPQEESTIREWDPMTNADREVWRPSSFLDPVRHRGDDSNSTILLGCSRQVVAQEWTHANALSPGLSGNYIWNSRHLDQLISLGAEPDPRKPRVARCNAAAVGRPDLACAQWILGGPESDFDFPDPSDRFWGAHSPFQLRNRDPHKTNIVIYDNGLHRPEGQYTRALELELDFTTMTARKVWEYRHAPDIFTAAVGRVVRLHNGNTLVNFGFGSAPNAPDPNVTHRIVEVARDGTIVAEIELQSFGKAVQYRSHVIPSIAGERLVRFDDDD